MPNWHFGGSSPGLCCHSFSTSQIYHDPTSRLTILEAVLKYGFCLHTRWPELHRRRQFSAAGSGGVVTAHEDPGVGAGAGGAGGEGVVSADFGFPFRAPWMSEI